MSTVMRVNFEPVSDILPITRRDFPLADKSLADPTNAIALVDGEWMTVNSDGKLVRASDITSVNDVATVRSFPLFMEKGRTDVQANASVKTCILWLGDYEFDTRIFDAAATASGGSAITTMFQPLKVATITIGSRNYCGLVGHAGAGDAEPVVGYVTRLPANNGGKLRFMKGYRV